MALGRDTRFTWYGHSCVEIRTPGGKTVLVDPWFGNPKSPKSADEVTDCDVMLVTHGHFDHIGFGGEGTPDAVAIAARTAPAWPCIHEMSLWLPGQLGDTANRVVGMNKGGRFDADGIAVTMVPAQHSAGDTLGETNPIYLGEPCGFVIELENGFRVYISGDTTVFGDMRLIRELYQPELAVLPIGGHFTMGPREAAMAVEMLGVSNVIPVHYGTFPVLAGTPDELRRELDERGVEADVHAPEIGGLVD